MTVFIEFIQRLIRGQPNPHYVRKQEAKETLEHSTEKTDTARDDFLNQLKRLQRALEGKRHGKHHPEQ